MDTNSDTQFTSLLNPTDASDPEKLKAQKKYADVQNGLRYLGDRQKTQSFIAFLEKRYPDPSERHDVLLEIAHAYEDQSDPNKLLLADAARKITAQEISGYAQNRKVQNENFTRSIPKSDWLAKLEEWKKSENAQRFQKHVAGKPEEYQRG